MPEGPEVRRYADLVHNAVAGRTITAFLGRTKSAKAWHENHADDPVVGHAIESVRAYGKNLVGHLNNDLFFYSHLMMWGRWHVHDAPPPEIDRRERARIVTGDNGPTAILMSAPIFEIHRGDPFAIVDSLRTLGPDILPQSHSEPFDGREFLRRLFQPENVGRDIGAVLLDQSVVAGIGNYLRAEMLFVCRIDPFRKVAELTDDETQRLLTTIPEMADYAYQFGGVTVPQTERDRMASDPTLIYAGTKAAEWATRHYVFRRTNLPCLVCGDFVRQKKQVTQTFTVTNENEEGEDKTRNIFFCPTCQNTTVTLPPIRKKREPNSPPPEVENEMETEIDN